MYLKKDAQAAQPPSPFFRYAVVRICPPLPQLETGNTMNIYLRPPLINGVSRRPQETGFSLLEMLLVVAVLMILATVSTLALPGVAAWRERIRLNDSAQLLAGHFERARTDALRRHAETSVQIINASSYSITMDTDGSGIPRTQTFSLGDGLAFSSSPTTITYNWRGCTASNTTIALASSNGNAHVNVTSGGDVALNSNFETGEVPSIYTASSPTDNVGTYLPQAHTQSTSSESTSETSSNSPTAASGGTTTTTPTTTTATTPGNSNGKQFVKLKGKK